MSKYGSPDQGRDRISDAERTDPSAGASRRRRYGSPRARILVAYVGVLVLVALLSLVGLRQLLTARTTKHADQALAEQLDRFVELPGESAGLRDAARLESVLDDHVEREGPEKDEKFVLFVGGRHHPTPVADALEHQQAGLLRPLAGTTRRRGGELDTSQGRFRYVIAPIGTADGRPAAFAVTLDFGSQLADEVNGPVQLTAGVLLVVALLGSGLMFLVAGRALAPLNVLAETARSINESNLTRRIPVDGHDEVAELARTFNAMLDRLESAFASQHNFVSDAEHELRTPLTIIRGHIEMISEDPHERRQTIELVLDELDRMTRLVGDLLVLARADQPDFLRLEPLDLDAFAEELHAKATGLAPREWRLVQSTPGRLTADRHRLTQAVMNLAENAVHHTQADEVIELGSALENGSASIWVRDRGPGIEPGDERRIFERFARGADAGARHGEGTGLGLAIVRVIAEAHGGIVRVRSRPGLGATFEIVLPTEPGIQIAPR